MDTLGREVLRQGLDLVTGGRGQPRRLPLQHSGPREAGRLPILAHCRKSEDDEIVLETARAVWEILQPEVGPAVSASD